MRFLFVGRFTNVGGSIKATLPFILKLRTLGYTVDLAHWETPNQVSFLKENNLFNLELHTKRNLLTKVIYLIQSASKYDVIIAISELTVTYSCQIAGLLNKIPVIGEIQVYLDAWIENNSSPFHRYLCRLFYPKLTAVRCVSQELSKYAVNEIGISSAKVFTVYNPFDLSAIEELSQQPLPEPAKNWVQNPFILCAGRLEKQKRFDLAIAAFKIVKKRIQIPIKLIILGEGSEKEVLQQEIIKSNIEDHTWLAGYYSNPYPFFTNATAFLLCSDYEGFGRVIVDAMAVGCPVIANNCPVGPTEILQHGKAGILLVNNQPETIAEGVIHLIHNPSITEKLISQGYKRSKDFSENKVSEDYIEKLKRYISIE